MIRALRSPLLAFAVLLMGLLTLLPVAARAQDREVQIETFYEELDRYGRWFTHPTHGYVWSPDVDPDWRPYSRGHWVFTDEHGWYWESEEPFGWAVFHYGRWFLDDDAGWVWVPGTEWGPAWVAWRNSDEQIGWAPLPPEAEWRGDHLSFSARYYDTPRYTAAWCFVPIAALTSYGIYRYIAPRSRNSYLVRQTTWVPSHRRASNRIFNAGIDRGRYERITRRQVPVVRLVDAPRPVSPQRPGSFTRTNQIQVYRPSILNRPANTPPPRLSDPPRRDTQRTFTRPGTPPVTRDTPRQPGTFIPPANRQANPPTQQQPATIPPPRQPGTFTPPPNRQANPPTQQQPATIPPPRQPGTFTPPPNRQANPPVQQQPATIPPPRQPGTFTPPPNRQANPPTQQQPATIPPPKQPAVVNPPPRQPPPQQRTAPPPQQPQQGAVPQQGRQGGPPPGQGGQKGPPPDGQKRRPPQPGEQPPQPR